jgi:hypothetical protein
MIAVPVGQFLADLLDSPQFGDAFKAVIAHEIEERVTYMRSLLRDNQINRALILEGEISALESLPSILQKHAATAKV